LLRVPSNLAFNVSTDGASTTSLGNPFQSFTNAFMEAKCLLQSLVLQPCMSLPKHSWEHRREGEKIPPQRVKEKLWAW